MELKLHEVDTSIANISQAELVGVRDDIKALRADMHALKVSGTMGAGGSVSSLKSVTEGGMYKTLNKFDGSLADYHDWAFRVRRVLKRSEETFESVLTMMRSRRTPASIKSATSS